MMINENIDVECLLANGYISTFENVKLKMDDVFIINIDGYYIIYCVEAKDIEYIELKLESGEIIMIKYNRPELIKKG